LNHNEYLQRVQDHWDRDELGQAIQDALIASGKSLDALTLDDLAPFDQFHGGGKWFTLRLAHLADLKPGMKVLDVGGGLGGPARTLALEFGCHVTAVDLTESYVQAGEMLTELMGLKDRVEHQTGNALDLSFEDSSFDVIWTQNSGMNIEDKESLYAGFRRVLRPNGLLVFQELMSGPNQPLVFPVMWSRDGANNFLREPEQMQAVIEEAGFRVRKWEDVTHMKTPKVPRPEYNIQKLVMGDELLDRIRVADKRNDEEDRLVMVQAVFERV
jgi:SAM-dependent methyltransferase